MASVLGAAVPLADAFEFRVEMAPFDELCPGCAT